MFCTLLFLQRNFLFWQFHISNSFQKEALSICLSSNLFLPNSYSLSSSIGPCILLFDAFSNCLPMVRDISQHSDPHIFFLMLALLRRTSFWPPTKVYIWVIIYTYYKLQPFTCWTSVGSFHELHLHIYLFCCGELYKNE